MNAPKKNVQPQDLESEQSLLGSLLLSKDAVALVIGKIQPWHFYKDAHAWIYEAILELYQKSQPVDLVTVSNELKKSDKLESIGGRSYLVELTEVVPTSSNAEYYSDIVIEKALLRQLIKAGSDMVKEAYDDSNDPKDVIDQAQSAIMELSKQGIKDNFIHLKHAVNTVFEQMQSTSADGKLIGVSTGYPDLDELTSGFQKGDLIILAARPSMGKTCFALNIAQHVAIQQKLPVAIFSCEMPSEQLAMRMLCSESKVDSQSLQSASLNDNQYRDLNIGMGRLSEAPIYIDDTPSISPLDLRAKCRRLQQTTDVKLIIIDYLQLLRGSKKRSESRFHEVSEIVREVKAFAKESAIPIIALSQLSRDTRDSQIMSSKRQQIIICDDLLRLFINSINVSS